MELDIDRLIQKLKDLGNKTQEIDDSLKDVRIKINDLFWNLIEIKNITVGKKRKLKRRNEHIDSQSL